MKINFRQTFVKLSIIFIGFMIILYGSRLIYFYISEHNKKTSKIETLIENITSSKNLIDNKDTMTKDKDTYYFYGKNPNNYIYYSGLMYRILYIKDSSIFAITDEVVTNLKFGSTKSFKDSNINEWLNDIEDNKGIFINNLSNTSLNLNSDKIALLDKDTFGKIGASKSFVVNEDFWVLDGDDALVVSENGDLTKTSNYADFLGIKPVIEIKGTNNYISGNGSLTNPYILEQRSISTLDDLYIGEYINYNNNDYRVIEKTDTGVKVVANEKLDNSHIFSYSNNKFNKNNYYDLAYYLNKNYIKELNTNDIVENNWYTGEYTLDYKDTYKSKVKTKIGLLKVGDYFIKNVKNSYLLTPSNDYIYTIDENGYLYQDSITSKLDIYPTFYLKNTLNVKATNKINSYVVGD